MLRVVVLGVAAGGGLPQWNCGCEICVEARRPNGRARPSTQASIAVSADDANWFIINASPDLRQQINATPALHPRESSRLSPVAGVILTNGDIDAIAGLLTLRERGAFTVHAHERVLTTLRDNTVFQVLAPDLVRFEPIATGREFMPLLGDGTPSGLAIEAFAVPGKVALYLEGDDPQLATEGGETIGLSIRETCTGQRFFHIPACAAMTDDLRMRLRDAQLVFFDGTLWRDDEMIEAGLGAKTGRRMGHMSMSGGDGSITEFAHLGVARKLFIHINNSNPVWLTDSPQLKALAAAGWELPHDGMEITL